jgi:hypothetical protein
MTAKSMAAMLILGCLATPAFADETAPNAAPVGYADNQFETSLTTDFQAWWQRHAPIAVAQTSPAPAVQPVSTPAAPASTSVAAAPADYADNQFETSLAADLQTWWQHRTPVAVARAN